MLIFEIHFESPAKWLSPLDKSPVLRSYAANEFVEENLKGLGACSSAGNS